jgi:glycosyltransferase involved in cell wall biosynthesis
MNVLWLAHAVPYPPKAGFLSRSYNLLRELARRQSVDLMAFIQEPWVRTLFPTLEEGLEESRHALESFCRSVTFLPIDRLRPRWGKQITALQALLSGSTYTTSWLVSEPARLAIARQVAANSYDLVHFDTIGLAPYRAVTGRIPATLTHHNIESHMMKRRAENQRNIVAGAYFRLEGQRLEAIEKRTAAQFAAHITCSDLDGERLHEIVPEANVVVIPNGVDCEFFSSQARPTRPESVVFVGSMNWYPNVDAMLFFLREIWPGLKKRVPGATMDIAGSSPPASLLKLARALPDVAVHGYLPDVRPLIDSAAVFVCPIRDGGGTKLKILDAFAMKKCVVAHPIACEGINVTAGTNVILASTAEEFVAEISRLFADDARRLATATAARQLAESEYSFQRIGEQFNSTVEDIVERSDAYARR